MHTIEQMTIICNLWRNALLRPIIKRIIQHYQMSILPLKNGLMNHIQDVRYLHAYRSKTLLKRKLVHAPKEYGEGSLSIIHQTMLVMKTMDIPHKPHYTTGDNTGDIPRKPPYTILRGIIRGISPVSPLTPYYGGYSPYYLSN